MNSRYKLLLTNCFNLKFLNATELFQGGISEKLHGISVDKIITENLTISSRKQMYLLEFKKWNISILI
jgi:hypothetical protein